MNHVSEWYLLVELLAQNLQLCEVSSVIFVAFVCVCLCPSVQCLLSLCLPVLTSHAGHTEGDDIIQSKCDACYNSTEFVHMCYIIPCVM